MISDLFRNITGVASSSFGGTIQNSYAYDMLELINSYNKSGVGMDIAAPGQAPATDDQELAKVLESMNNSLTTAPAGPVAAIDEPADTSPADDGVQLGAPAPVVAPVPEPVMAPAPEEAVAPQPAAFSAPAVEGDLASIKKDALTELRPLVDKLNLPAEEKFDTLLLIIRSTDDKSLVSQAHAAAKAIEDDGRRAEALLDVIKEIDYFSNPAA